MTNVDKLRKMDKLDGVMGRLGMDEGEACSIEYVNDLSSDELVALWAGWTLGSETWWWSLKKMFDDLEAKHG